MKNKTYAAENYSPLYFLASLGAGGLAVTFFMYLFFWVPHPNQPVPIFEDIWAFWPVANLVAKAAMMTAMLGIAVFTFLNIKALLWNFRAYAKFKKTESYKKLRNSNGETSLLAAPLASAMTVNALFIVGLVFVPGLYSVIEFLFPFALLAFMALAIWALRLIGSFLGRILSEGGLFDVTAHNSFAQLLPAFALAMIAVGLAAPAAMSSNASIVGISLLLSTLLGFTAMIYAALAATTALNSMLHYGTAREAAPTLMVIVPIVTILSIMFMRQDHGLHTTFDAHQNAGETMLFLARMITLQLVFLALGLLVLRRQGYFSAFIFGDQKSAGSYALICPGVAFSVLGQFFINKGLVAAGVVAKFGVAYWSLTAIAIFSQVLMIWLLFRLNARHFRNNTLNMEAVPAE